MLEVNGRSFFSAPREREHGPPASIFCLSAASLHYHQPCSVRIAERCEAMKRKAQKQQVAGTYPVFGTATSNAGLMPSSGPVSAFAARKARQQQAQSAAVSKELEQESASEPPFKRRRRSIGGEESDGTNGAGTPRSRTRLSKKQNEPMPAVTVKGQSGRSNKNAGPERPSPTEPPEESEEEVGAEAEPSEGPEEMGEEEVASIVGDADGYESPAETPAELQNFPLSKARLNKSNVVYADDSTLCVRIKERSVCVELSN